MFWILYWTISRTILSYFYVLLKLSMLLFFLSDKFYILLPRFWCSLRFIRSYSHYRNNRLGKNTRLFSLSLVIYDRKQTQQYIIVHLFLHTWKNANLQVSFSAVKFSTEIHRIASVWLEVKNIEGKEIDFIQSLFLSFLRFGILWKLSYVNMILVSSIWSEARWHSFIVNKPTRLQAPCLIASKKINIYC